MATLLTKSDLFAGVWRQNEGEQGQRCDGGSRHDQVEIVVERATSQSDVKHDVWVRLDTALVVLDAEMRRRFYTAHTPHTLHTESQ